jgi:hypothetical protein
VNEIVNFAQHEKFNPSHIKGYRTENCRALIPTNKLFKLICESGGFHGTTCPFSLQKYISSGLQLLQSFFLIPTNKFQFFGQKSTKFETKGLSEL